MHTRGGEDACTMWVRGARHGMDVWGEGDGCKGERGAHREIIEGKAWDSCRALP